MNFFEMLLNSFGFLDEKDKMFKFWKDYWLFLWQKERQDQFEYEKNK